VAEAVDAAKTCTPGEPDPAHPPPDTTWSDPPWPP